MIMSGVTVGVLGIGVGMEVAEGEGVLAGFSVGDGSLVGDGLISSGVGETEGEGVIFSGHIFFGTSLILNTSVYLFGQSLHAN